MNNHDKSFLPGSMHGMLEKDRRKYGYVNKLFSINICYPNTAELIINPDDGVLTFTIDDLGETQLSEWRSCCSFVADPPEFAEEAERKR